MTTRRPRNLPAFNKPELEAINNRLQAANIPSSSREMIMRSLNAAANPQVETPEFGIQALPPERRRIAEQSAQETGEIFSFTNNVVIGFSEQSEYNEALVSARENGRDSLSWEFVAALLLAYFLFPKEQQTALFDSILKAYVASWQNAVAEQAARYGCRGARIGNPPRDSLSQMREWATRDSDSITATYDKEAQNALRKLYDGNPLGNVAYFLNGMAQWASTRQQRKNLTIGIQNAQAGYQLGLQDFHVNNRLQTKYAFSGAPPICPICVRLYSLGHVDYQTMVSNSAPVHPNCPHYWVSVNTYQIDCATMWVGV